MNNLHKNSQKRINAIYGIYSVTTKTIHNYPFFKEQILCELFIEELKLCREILGFRLLAFCILYDHIHLMIQVDEVLTVSKVMQFIKRHFSRDANNIICNEGDIRECRLHGGKFEQFKDIVNKHDHIINNIKSQFTNQNINLTKFQWQRSFHDHIIRNQKDLTNHYNYITSNHFKHKLPFAWKYTSSNYHYLIDYPI